MLRQIQVLYIQGVYYTPVIYSLDALETNSFFPISFKLREELNWLDPDPERT